MANIFEEKSSASSSSNLLSVLARPVSWLTLVGCLSTFSLPSYACTIPKSIYKNVTCTPNSRYFIASRDSGTPVALLNSKGKRITDLMRYSKVDVDLLSDGVFPVMRNRKVGYMNLKGREVIPAVYDPLVEDRFTLGWARASHDNRIIVSKNGKIGIISSSGKIILPFSSSYKTITDYKNGTAQLFKNNESFWINRSARRTTNPNQPSSNPPAPSSNNSDYAGSHTPVVAPTNPPPTNNPLTSNNMPLEIWQPTQRDGKWGFVNSEGVPMITFSFENAMPYSQGLAGVKTDGKWGFVDLKGDLVIPFRFDEAGVMRKKTSNYQPTYKGKPPFLFVDDKAWVGNLTNGGKLCIDLSGQNVGCDEDTNNSPLPETLSVDNMVDNAALQTSALIPTPNDRPIISEIEQKPIEPMDSVSTNVLTGNTVNTTINSNNLYLTPQKETIKESSFTDPFETDQTLLMETSEGSEIDESSVIE